MSQKIQFFLIVCIAIATGALVLNARRPQEPVLQEITINQPDERVITVYGLGEIKGILDKAEFLITFETKYKMFINYLKPFRDVDINWETTLQARLSRFISMQVMAHAIYDSKVLFDKVDKEGNPVLDSAGKKIREPRLQFREFFTIGFIYWINKRVVRARAVN